MSEPGHRSDSVTPAPDTVAVAGEDEAKEA